MILTKKKREHYSNYLGVPSFSDYHEMMKEMGDQIQIVSVLSASGDHAKHCIDLAPYGKHIIVEKPMALTLQDADKMIRACDQNGIRLFVVKQNRFNPPVMKLKQAIDDNQLGNLHLGTVRVRWCRDQNYYDQHQWRGTWKMDGGVFANQAIHHIDLLQWLMGDVESVFAKSGNFLSNIEVEDTGIAVIKFASGALGIIEATTATRPTDLEGSVSVLGAKGTVEIGGFAVNEMKTWKVQGQEDLEQSIIQDYRTNPDNVYGHGHYAFLQNVIHSIGHEKAALVNGLEAKKSLEIVTALYESIETEKEVFLRFKPKQCKLGIQ